MSLVPKIRISLLGSMSLVPKIRILGSMSLVPKIRILLLQTWKLISIV